MALCQCVSILLVLVVYTAAQQGDFCSYKPSSMMPTLTLTATQESDWSETASCRCEVTFNFNNTISLTRVVALDVHFKYMESSDPKKPIEGCLPMMQVIPTRRNNIDDPLGVKYDVCPLSGQGTHHTGTAVLYRGIGFGFHIYNPGKRNIEARLNIQEFEGEIVVTCGHAERIMYEEADCPCYSGNPVGGTAAEAKYDENRRLLIGLVTAFVFAAVLVAIIVAVYFYKKRRAKKVERDINTAENKAYQGSKQSITEKPKEQPISYIPDPSLNLKLQKSPHHGSKDSGLASSNDNNRLPFMQPNAASNSVDNLNQMGTNYPSLAGQGSVSSLDTVVDPVYTTRPGPKSSNTGPARVPPQEPMNYPPLAGQGSQSSLDHINSYPPDPADLYAKPMKRRPQEEMSQSYDRIRFDNPPIATQEKFHSSHSLNTSLHITDV